MTNTRNPNFVATRQATLVRPKGVYAPRVDVVETADELFLYADLPGVKSEDVSLDFKDGELILHAKCAPRFPDRRVVYAEYGVGDYHRRFRINESIDTERIDAAMMDGVLAIRLPKAEQAKPKRITVKCA